MFIVWRKQWNKQKIIKKWTFSVKRNFSREIAYIPIFWIKKRWSFLDKMLILKKRWKRDNLCNFERKKWIAMKSLYISCFFLHFYSKHGNEKKKTLKNPFSWRNIYFFIEMACTTFYVTWKRDFLQNVVKTNKKV